MNIPDGWKQKSILQLGSNNKDTVQTGPFGAQLHASDYVKEGIPLILIRNINANGLNTDNIPKITAEDANRLRRYSLKKNDIVFSRVGRVGSCFLATLEQEGWIISGQTLRIRIPKKAVDHKFLNYSLKGDRAQSFIRGTAIGSTRKSISTKTLEDLPVLLPPLPEQRRIAEILDEWDKAITLTERLIETKQTRKKGLMQKLLTGKVRFGEFVQSEEKQETKFGDLPKDWDIVHIKDIANVNAESLSKKSDTSYTYFYIDLSSVDRGSIALPQERERFGDLPSRARRVLRKNDVIMATVRPYLLGFAVCDFEPKDILCSTGFALISPKTRFDSNFIYQSLYGDIVSRQLQALLVGSNYPAINSSDVNNLRLFWPKDAIERRKIASVLQSCDEEIDLLGQKLAALKRQKKGLMQQLLTGKVRV